MVEEILYKNEKEPIDLGTIVAGAAGALVGAGVSALIAGYYLVKYRPDIINNFINEIAGLMMNGQPY